MYKCGIDIGGTNIKIGFFKEGVEDELLHFKTPSDINEFVPLITKNIIKRHKLEDILGYVISIPGVCNNGVVVYAPNTNILGLQIEDEFKKALNNTNIIIDNDANIQALAESRAGNLNDLILLTLGTGFGGGIVIDGKLHNKNGYAGEVGHIKVHFGQNSRVCGCGKKGCAEAYVSARAIVREFNELTHKNINSRILFDLAKKGNKLAIKGIKDCARYLAITIADIVSVLGIKNVRIAGGLSNSGDAFLDYVRKYYPDYSVLNMEDISIEVASLQSDAGTIAAKYLL